MEETTPPTIPSQSLSRKSHKKLYIGIGCVVVLLGVLVAAYIYTTKINPAEAWNVWTMPAELRGARVLSTSNVRSVVYTAGPAGYIEKEVFPGEALDAIPSAAGTVFISADSNGFMLSSKGLKYYAGPTIAAAVVSSDGSSFAFTRIIGTTTAQFNPDIAKWEIILVGRGDGQPHVMGPGTAPFFTDNSHLGRATAAGIYLTDLSTGIPSQMLSLPINVPLLQLHQSPDRTLLAWNDGQSSRLTIYRAVDGTLSKIASLPAMRQFTLANNAVYELRTSDSGTEVWKYTLEDSATPKRIYTFPVRINVSQFYL